MIPEWKADVPTLDVLNRMAAEPLPLGLRSGAVEQFFQRDIYYDSADWTLRRRGVTCRFRIRVDDRRILTVRAIGRSEAGIPLVLPQSFEAEVPELEGEQALAGTSDPARRLRALLEPGRLIPRIQFETERRVRRTRPRWLSRTQFEIAYDVVTCRSHQLAQAFQELKIRQLGQGRPSLDELARVFQQQYGLRPLLLGKVDRAEKLLRDLESEGLAQGARGSREVGVIVLEEGSVALLSDAAALTVPVRGGSGEDSCREILRTHFGSADGQVRFLGTAPAAGTRPVLEVWLARRVSGAGTSGPSGRLQWLPFDELLAGAGAPGLRDPRTLAALTVAARSETLAEWTRGAPPESGGEAPREPRTGERRIRLSDVALRSPLPDPGRPGPEHFLNSDLSLIEFNARVLALADDPRVPLLARLRFLSIVSANLDEFFMVRVAALKRAVAAGVVETGEDGLSPEEQLDAVAIRVRALLERQSHCFGEALVPGLAAHGVRIMRWADLAEPQREAMRRYFAEQVFPIVTPQAITRAPGHPFPLITNLRLSLALVVRDPRAGPMHFAYLKVPDTLPRFVKLSDGGGFVPVDDVIRENLTLLYPGRLVDEAYAFRVTRGADLELDEHHAVSLLQVIEEETKRRPWGAPVRVEVERAMPTAIRELLLRELQFEETTPASPLGSGDVYEVDGLLDLGSVREIARVPLPDLDYPPHLGRAPIAPARSVFALLAERDLLVHHPYDSFEATVERLFVEAADDPDVAAIKCTLYRAGGRSGIVEALLRAAGRGKEVFVFVELKARFDEERNIDWARKLEQAGIRVVYGLVELKTHAKTALIVRHEPEGIRRYVHVGTGNYNAATAALYTDLGLLSADPALGADLNDLFNELSGSSEPPQTAFRRILVSPTFLLTRLVELIDREAEHARAGRPGRVRAKLNGLADPDIIAALYRASQAGVDVDLVVRGICTLRPGVIGLSERIRVVSVLGRFLEHARICQFANGGDPEYFIGSADWRPRNLRRRVEVVTPVRDADCRRRLDEILDAELADPLGWDLMPDGSYLRRSGGDAEARSAQEVFTSRAAGDRG